MAKLENIEGIGAKYAGKLKKAGVKSVNEMPEPLVERTPPPQRAEPPVSTPGTSASLLKRQLPLIVGIAAVLVVIIGWALWKGFEGIQEQQRLLEEQRHSESRRMEEERAALQRQREAEAERQRRAEAQRQEDARQSAAARQRQEEAARQAAAVREQPAPEEEHPVSTSRSSAGETTVALGGGVTLRMKHIPAGSFLMGASPGDGGATSDEKPAHRVTISEDFHIGVTEVTQAQWRAVMGNDHSFFQGDDLPVEQVSWDDAVLFCEKLSRRTGQRYRLPTEAEWEYAARAGTTTKYYWGNAMDDACAWYEFNSGYAGNNGSIMHPVGQKRANAWGLYDMSGNVFEWCSDWYGSYGSSSQTDPKGAQSGSVRVKRGGCWGVSDWGLRSSHRLFNAPSHRSKTTGFRLVREGF